MPLDVLLGDDISDLTAAQRATLRALRLEAAEAMAGGPFDPRRVLTMAPAALAGWQQGRDAHLASLFARDRRVAR